LNADIGVFYQAGSSYLIAYDSEHATLDLILQVPVINKQNYSSLFHIFNNGFLTNSTYIKLVAPDVIVKDDNSLFQLNTELCIQRNFFFLCKLKAQERSRQTDCLYNIIFNNSTQLCESTPRLSHTEEFYTYSAVGLHLTTRQAITLVYKRNEKPISKNHLYYTYFFPYETFDVIKTTHLELPTRHTAQFEIEYQTVPVNFDMDFTFNLQSLQTSITSLGHLLRHEKNHLPSKFQELHLHPVFSTFIFSFMILILLFLFLIILFVYLRYKKKQHSKIQPSTSF
jgi:hypothetical protein